MTVRPIVASAVLGCVLTAQALSQRPLVRVEMQRLSMACVYSIVAYGEPAEATKATLEQALDEIDRIDRLMSNYHSDSALSRLNRQASGGPTATDPELFALIATAQGYSEASGGAFDITVGPLMKAWGFFRGEGRLPSAHELADVRQRVGYRHVVVDRDRQTVGFDRPGIELDLGAIAKGYAVDRAAGVLRRAGITGALVNGCGSSIYGIGTPPDKDAWDVDVQDPIRGGAIAMKVLLKDRALSVSGRSERWFELGGVTYSHIMDPRTGRPVQGMLSVVMVTDDATSGDALGTTLFVLGPDAGRALLESAHRAEAYFFVPAAKGSWKTVHLQPNEQDR